MQPLQEEEARRPDLSSIGDGTRITRGAMLGAGGSAALGLTLGSLLSADPAGAGGRLGMKADLAGFNLTIAPTFEQANDFLTRIGSDDAFRRRLETDPKTVWAEHGVIASQSFWDTLAQIGETMALPSKKEVQATLAGTGTIKLPKLHASKTTLAAPVAAGDTMIKVTSVSDIRPGDLIGFQKEPDPALDYFRVASVGTAGAAGTGVTLTSAIPTPHGGGTAAYRRSRFITWGTILVTVAIVVIIIVLI